ncbi:AAA domain-containing protein, partial [Prescottella equi]
GDFAFDPVPVDRLDDITPPEQMFSILDADSSQRRCILAAANGKSFVMDGPPGTGKSQTIANMIAELMATGKSVLFVSEKAAALDVV